MLDINDKINLFESLSIEELKEAELLLYIYNSLDPIRKIMALTYMSGMSDKNVSNMVFKELEDQIKRNR